jgi:hypothetical protein
VKADMEAQKATQGNTGEAMEEDPCRDKILSEFGATLGNAVLERL